MRGLFDGELAAALFRLAAQREIPRDFRVADERSVRVPYRREDDVGPEQRAVLSDAPPFILESPVSRGHLELVPREPRGDHVCRIKRFERAAEDLVCCVPFNLQCAFVPADDTAFGI